MLSIRADLSSALGLDAGSLPFAGELIEVRQEERAWEGAAERLLHGFALSLLVPDEHYTAVASWVDATHLGGRLVYFRVQSRPGTVRARRDARAMTNKLAIKDRIVVLRLAATRARRALRPHLLRESRRTEARGEGDHACRPDQDRRQAAREGRPQAASTTAQPYVLGWSNAGKIAALEKASRRSSRAACRRSAARSPVSTASAAALRGRARHCFNSFLRLPASMISTGVPIALEIDRAARGAPPARGGLGRAARRLKAQLDGIEQAIAESEGQLDAATREHSKLERTSRRGGAAARRRRSRRLPRSPRTCALGISPSSKPRAPRPGRAPADVESCDRSRARDARLAAGAHRRREPQARRGCARQDRRRHAATTRSLSRRRRARSTPRWRRPPSTARCWPR